MPFDKAAMINNLAPTAGKQTQDQFINSLHKAFKSGIKGMVDSNLGFTPIQINEGAKNHLVNAVKNSKSPEEFIKHLVKYGKDLSIVNVMPNGLGDLFNGFKDAQDNAKTTEQWAKKLGDAFEKYVKASQNII